MDGKKHCREKSEKRNKNRRRKEKERKKKKNSRKRKRKRMKNLLPFLIYFFSPRGTITISDPFEESNYASQTQQQEVIEEPEPVIQEQKVFFSPFFHLFFF